MSESVPDVLSHFSRVKDALQVGQAQVEGLIAFLRDRVAIEDQYSKQLLRFTKMGMSIDGACVATCSPPLRCAVRHSHPPPRRQDDGGDYV
jgi:hypothetical protein